MHSTNEKTKHYVNTRGIFEWTLGIFCRNRMGNGTGKSNTSLDCFGHVYTQYLQPAFVAGKHLFLFNFIVIIFHTHTKTHALRYIGVFVPLALIIFYMSKNM